MDIKNSHSRSKNITKNVVVSLLLKGISIGISLLMVPMTLNYLDQERYGLWLTMSSIIGWFSLFDIGLGNGFRNKFAEALAIQDIPLAKTYVSTTFALLSIIIGVVLGVFLVVNPFLNWRAILNTQVESQRNLSWLALIIFTFFALQFIFKLTTSVLLADQKSSLVDLISVSGSLLSLVIVYLVMRIGERSLLFLGLTLSACPVLVLIGAYFVVFNGKYQQYKPSIKCIDLKQSKGLMGLGLMFFIPQICSLIVFSTSNVIITQLFTPAEVTVYNIAFKYFSVVTLFFNIIITPFWSAFTEAFVKQDVIWIKKVIHKLVLIWGLSCVGAVLMVIVSNFAYNLWVGNQVIIPIQMSICLAVYVCVSNWNSIFGSFNNGASKIFIQIWLSIIAGVVFVPLSILLSKKTGLMGIPLAMALSVFPGSFISPLQYSKLINCNAKGIWNK
jgi:O-antigen/teichoic acid export membrane protein